jgi:hypothetical protein
MMLNARVNEKSMIFIKYRGNLTDSKNLESANLHEECGTYLKRQYNPFKVIQVLKKGWITKGGENVIRSTTRNNLHQNHFGVNIATDKISDLESALLMFLILAYKRGMEQ